MMSFLSDLAGIVTENEPLGRLTYFGVGGPARWMVRPRSVAELAEVVRRCRQEGVSCDVLGLGANLLVGDDGVDGVVVRLNDPAFGNVVWGDDKAGGRGVDGVAVTVGAGKSMARLTLDAVLRGLAGLETLAGIPGSLGGFIRMNAGGRFGQISDVVSDVTVVDPAGEIRRLTRDEVGFRYRHSGLTDMIVVAATLVLRPEDKTRLRERYTEIWEYKKASQPLADYSAGCIFKNPPDGSAGQLIDKAGLKRYAIGGASVSEHHANFIVAEQGARARDVLALIGHIRRTVAARFGVELEIEVQVWDRSRTRSMELV